MARNKNTDNPEGSLFPAEELTRVTGGFDFEEEKPVTVLGITFENDAKRREYFREELRKRLPELRKIEGFPIGSDDDIINLSDPPYYTACPNPWLNDFVDEWEQEKAELEKEGKRSKDFEVKEPYASDVSEGKRNPIYDTHSYHTKVPHPAIMRYILHYTQPGDIILDGFCGTGMTGVAASLCENSDYATKQKIEQEFSANGYLLNWGGRHAILSDLSPVASLIAGNYNSPLSSHNVFDKIEKILDECENTFEWMYKTTCDNKQKGNINYTVWSDVFTCPNCGAEYVFYDEAVNHETNEIYTEYPCPHCGSQINKKSSNKSFESFYDPILHTVCNWQKKVPVLINYSLGKSSGTKKLDIDDFEILNRAKRMAESFSYVSDRMIEGSESRRNDRQGITNIHHFYFPRTLLIYEYLFNRCDCKEMFFLLNSQLINLSKLNRYRPGKSFPYNPLSGTLYIGSQISESNVFVALRNKLKKMRTSFSLINSCNATGVCSATNLSIKDNSVDYIFTDPPFGANFYYSELNFIQEGWLKVKTDNTEEAIENDAQDKTKNVYQTLMSLCLKEYYRILKPNKWITIEFSNTSASIWNAIQQAIKNAGFVIASVAALDKQQGSFKAITTTTAVKQDLVLTCFKPSDNTINSVLKQSKDNKNVYDFVDELLAHLPVHLEKGEKTTAIVERSPKILFDRVVSYFVQHGILVPLDATEFQKGLHERYIERDGMFFNEVQAAEYDEKKKQAPVFVPLGIIVSDEANGIQWLKNQLRDEPKTYQELQPEWMQAINGVRKGDILPELKDLLDENFIETEDGKWRLPNIQDDVDKEALRTKALLREFKHYVELAQKPKGKLKEVRVEALRAGFKDCYVNKDFQTIVTVGDKIPQNLRDEDETLLQFYDIAMNKL